MTKILATQGKGWYETTYQVPDITDRQIRVRSVLTGVCSSDVAMGKGEFGPLPLHCMGHEGLAQVIEVGKDVQDCQVGDYVATRGEPAFADEYVCEPQTYVVVPEALPRYILEPVACALNCVGYKAQTAVSHCHIDHTPRMLIIGTGFLSKVICQYMLTQKPTWQVTVWGTYHKDYFNQLGVEVVDTPRGEYHWCVDLSPTDRIQSVQMAQNGCVVLAAEKHPKLLMDFQQWLWQSVSVVLPSPRASGFHHKMAQARDLIHKGVIEVDQLWSTPTPRAQWPSAFDQQGQRQCIRF